MLSEIESKTDEMRNILEKTLCLLSEERKTPYKTYTKEDGTIVTELDLMSDLIIKQGLNDLFGAVDIISEESTVEDNVSILKKKSFFVLDPLDGTKSFNKGGNFSINLAFCENKKPIWTMFATFDMGEVETFFTYQGGLFRLCNGKSTKVVYGGDSCKKPLFAVGSKGCKINKLGFDYIVAPAMLKLKKILNNEANAIYLPICSDWDIVSMVLVAEILGFSVLDGYDKKVELFGDKSFVHRDVFLFTRDNYISDKEKEMLF